MGAQCGGDFSWVVFSHTRHTTQIDRSLTPDIDHCDRQTDTVKKEETVYAWFFFFPIPFRISVPFSSIFFNIPSFVLRFD